MKVRTRYAPSPTGFQHIGGIRTALYAYLFAKGNNGDLILRIEDTDQSRYVEQAEKYIIDSLSWLNIKPDEGVGFGGEYGPYRQSERKKLYHKHALDLVMKGHAYFAFDTPEELEAMRDRLSKEKASNQQYNALTRMQMRNTLTMTEQEVQEAIARGDKYVIRVKLPENETITFQDEVRGEVSFNTNQMDDKVMFKSDGMPTYHLANVVDDRHMKVTHVIRGEEWLSSTPLHVLLYRFFGWEDKMPTFAHLPLMLNPNGKGKLSKRGKELGFPVFPLAWEDLKKGQSADGYREIGFIPGALVNFLAFQGWNPGTEQEIFSQEELAKAFSLDRVSKSGSRFDFEKAKWFNAEYLKAMSDEALADLVLAQKSNTLDYDRAQIVDLVGMMKERMTFPQDFWTQAGYFFEAPKSYDEKTIRKKWKDENKAHLNQLKDKLNALGDFQEAQIEKTVKSYIEENDLKFGDILLPLRLLLTGQKGGPSVFAIAEKLGKEESIKRIQEGFQVFDKIANAAS